MVPVKGSSPASGAKPNQPSVRPLLHNVAVSHSLQHKEDTVVCQRVKHQGWTWRQRQAGDVKRRACDQWDRNPNGDVSSY